MLAFHLPRIATGALAFLWLIALFTHSMQDIAWSTSGLGVTMATRNGLGQFGAYLADITLYPLGRSIYLVPVLLLLGAVWSRWHLVGYRLAAVFALVCASATLEWLVGANRDVVLPSGSGGIVGAVLGQTILTYLGWFALHQSSLALLLVVCCAMALAFIGNFSWTAVSLTTGMGLGQVFNRLTRGRQIQGDEALGRDAAKEREIERLQAQTFSPLVGAVPTKTDYPSEQITPLFGDLEVTGVAASPIKASKPLVTTRSISNAPSKRMIKESQTGLFDDEVPSSLPRLDLLDAVRGKQETVSESTLEMTSRLIEKKLSDFGVSARVVTAMPGPVITRYEIEPATGVKGSQIVNLAKDLARSLSLASVRVIETIPGKNLMALELPNAKRQSIGLSEILGSNAYNDAKSLLTLGLGKDIVGDSVAVDLAKMPHCLVAGTTGSGKSVGINAMILSLLYKASAKEVRLLLIDPKMLEMSVYEGIPHLIAPVVTDMRQAAHGLNWCVAEMERRYKLMSKLGVRNLSGYNSKIADAQARGSHIANPFSLNPELPEPLEKLPHLVVVIDELADLMMVAGKKIEELIARLAQKARAAGIHLILATQRPSVDVITGLIKANIPTRIAFQVSSKIDSRTILDQMGAEALLGMGDMLYMASGTGLPVRVHGAFVSDEEVHRVVSYIKAHAEPNYIEGVLDASGEGDDGISDAGDGIGSSGEKDPLYDQAVQVVLKNRKASISLVQRHLKVGYNRAARMLEDMQSAGLVSALTSSGQREILVNQTQTNEP